MNRKLQKELTRQKLLHTSMRLFAEKGFDQVSVDDIVAEAGSSKGSFYHHFYSKDTVLIEVVNMVREELIRIIKVKIISHSEEQSSKKLLEIILKSVCEFYCEDYERINLLVSISNEAGINSRIFHLDDLHSIFTTVLLSGAHSREFDLPTQPEWISKYFTSSLYTSLIDSFLETKNKESFCAHFLEVTDSIKKVFFHGILLK